MANFFIKKDSSFEIVIPFDCRSETPQMLLGPEPSNYPAILQSLPEEDIQFHWFKFRRPDWGLDCYLRELGFTASKTGEIKDRVLSQDRLNEVRLRYLTMDASFFAAESKKITFSPAEHGQVLTTDCEDFLKTMDPAILNMFLRLACNIWDFGMAPNMLFTKDDYLSLRNDPEGLKKLQEARNPKSASLVKEGETDKKK